MLAPHCEGRLASLLGCCRSGLLFNEAFFGALLVLLDHVGGLERSATHALFLCLHFGNTLLLLAALAFTAKWLSNRDGHFAMVIGMTGSLAASLGGTLFPADSLRHAVVEDYSTSSHILLRLRVLHDRRSDRFHLSFVAAPDSRAKTRALALDAAHTNCSDRARHMERDPVDPCLAADGASTCYPAPQNLKPNQFVAERSRKRG